MNNMTNEEKKEYISLKLGLLSIPFISEIQKKSEIIEKTPKTLFKFRKFDEFTEEMIKEDYVYLAPAGSLDDPFDCLVNIDFENIAHSNNSKIKKSTMEYLIDKASHYASKSLSNRKQDIKNIFIKVYSKGDVDSLELKRELSDTFSELSELEINALTNILVNTPNVFEETILQNKSYESLLKTYSDSKENVGVCSLTTKRDNKVMWSLYGDVYKGYCIEYEVPFNNRAVIDNLCPVIYDRDFENNFIKATCDFAIGSMVRAVFHGKLRSDISAYVQLIVTKDPDWEYQEEWRILGKAGQMVKNIKIKNIYLGFNVSAVNEKKILKLAKTKGFDAYKMNEPKGPKEIIYRKLT